MLPLTVREFCFDPSKANEQEEEETKEGAIIIDGFCYGLPDWWLPCFDLSTEFHLFAKEFERRSEWNHSNLQEEEKEKKNDEKEMQVKEKRLLANNWFIKPCGGTRGFGHRILTQESSPSSFSQSTLEGLHHAAVFAPMLSSKQLSILLDLEKYRYTSEKFQSIMSDLLQCTYLPYDSVDRVAQLLVDYPLLMKNRKFDMRYYVFVRSFYPFEGTEKKPSLPSFSLTLLLLCLFRLCSSLSIC